jgi:hypothetical protein
VISHIFVICMVSLVPDEVADEFEEIGDDDDDDDDPEAFAGTSIVLGV